MKCYYIVAAAGVGKRMALSYPKQFMEHNGKPIFIYTLETIDKSDFVHGIVISTNEEYIDTVKGYIYQYGIKKVLGIVAGGKERQDSINNAVTFITEFAEKDDIIGIQDGVRPFIKEKYISGTYEKLLSDKSIDGISVGVKAKDTIKIVNDNGQIIDTPDRKNVVAIHTPQVFRFGKLKESYDAAYTKGFYGTDDSMLVERNGGVVAFFEGDYDNVKITTVEDLVFLGK